MQILNIFADYSIIYNTHMIYDILTLTCNSNPVRCAMTIESSNIIKACAFI